MKTVLEAHAKLLSGQLPKGTKLIVVADDGKTLSVAACVRNSDDMLFLLLSGIAKITAESDKVNATLEAEKKRLLGGNN